MVRSGRSALQKSRSLLFFFFLLIALFADFVLFGRVNAALVSTFLALSDGFVAAGSVLLAFFANLVVFVRLDATFVLTFLAFGFRLDATAFARKDGAGTNHQSHSEGQSRQCSM